MPTTVHDLSAADLAHGLHHKARSLPREMCLKSTKPATNHNGVIHRLGRPTGAAIGWFLT